MKVRKGLAEEHIVELQHAKRVLTHDVIGEDAEIFKSLSQEEIINLF